MGFQQINNRSASAERQPLHLKYYWKYSLKEEESIEEVGNYDMMKWYAVASGCLAWSTIQWSSKEEQRKINAI